MYVCMYHYYHGRGVINTYYRRSEDYILIKQDIVPKGLRSEMLKIGHEGLLSGHLGIRKSLDRILAHFYWPGILGEVKRYCQSYDILQDVPQVHLPFDKVAIDLIGPLLPVSQPGNRWILTLVDYSTRYPEAVLLKNIDTQSVAEALLGIFTTIGFPRALFSDNGTQFALR